MNRRSFLRTATLSMAAFALLGAAPAQSLGELSTAWHEAARQDQLLIVIIARDPAKEDHVWQTDWAWAAADWLLQSPASTQALLAQSRVVVARKAHVVALTGKAPPAPEGATPRLLVVRPANPTVQGWVQLPDEALQVADWTKQVTQRHTDWETARAEGQRALADRVTRVDQAFRAALTTVGVALPAEAAASPAYLATLQQHAPGGGQWCWPSGCGPNIWEGDPGDPDNGGISCGMGHVPDSLSRRFLGLMHSPI